MRTREVMFRIGGEEDLLDRPAVAASASRPSHAEAAVASRPSTTAACAVCPPDASVPPSSAAMTWPAEGPVATDAAVLDASVPNVPARGGPPRSAGGSERSPAAAPNTSVSPLLPDLDRRGRAIADGSISKDNTAADASGLRRWREEPTALLKGGQRPRLAKLHRCVAWVNALIFTVLIVAAVIGHTPASTTAASSGATPVRQAARPVAARASTRFASSRVLRGPPSRCALPSRLPCPRLTARSGHPDSGDDRGNPGGFGR